MLHIESANLRVWLAFLFLLSLMIVALLLGSVHVPLHALWDASSPYHEVIWQLRFPRAVNALLVGASLSLAGLLIQNLVKNPLADPYLLGVSGGAAMVQLSVIITGLSVTSLTLFISGFLGSILATLILLKLSYVGEFRPNKITLNGVVLAFGFAAMISFVLATAEGHQIKSMMFWLMGDLSFAELNVLMPLILVAVIIILVHQSRSLDILARGELFAQKSGVHTKRLNLQIFIVTAVLTSMAVAQAGTIGFVGLIIPHIVRIMVGYKHRQLIPMTVLVGAGFLLIADTLARTIMSPIQLPVGIFTALIGVPVFIWLNRKV
ncbi:MAG: iron ABC transporter permease [Marinicella sp.]